MHASSQRQRHTQCCCHKLQHDAQNQSNLSSICRRISLDLFSHMLDLDLHYHLHRKTGEVMRILDRGTGAIQNILSTVVFAIGPQVQA